MGFVLFISANAGWKSLLGLCSPFCSLPLFSIFASLLFFLRWEVAAAAAAGFLPEQFFKLFTRRLAALTLCFSSVSRGDILPALPCSPAFALLLLKPSNNPPSKTGCTPLLPENRSSEMIEAKLFQPAQYHFDVICSDEPHLSSDFLYFAVKLWVWFHIFCYF